MIPLYNFGLSQEDPLTEIKGLDLKNGDSLLCIAGAGEVPLNISAMKNVSIVAVDSSENQLHLSRIKQKAGIRLELLDAAGFLGYMKMPGVEREKLFNQAIAPYLFYEDLLFWRNNMDIIRHGVIHAGKFEQFINKASFPALLVIGKKNFYRLFECNSTEEQEAVFDRFFAKVLLKTIFKMAFHPGIYKNRGIDATGMQHHQQGNIGDFFFNRFRSFCTSTPARKNFLLQYIFFRQSLFAAALPEYLKMENHETFLRNQQHISFVSSTMENFLSGSLPGAFNKIQLSNIGDWMSKETMAGLFRQIQEKTLPGNRIVVRYIYFEHPVPEALPFLKPDHQLGEALIKADRFPFTSVVPIQHINHEQLPDNAT
jgi:S-adenosylmethionine:diacylglycerol 3-amino-3-carboxypropyl transferase